MSTSSSSTWPIRLSRPTATDFKPSRMAWGVEVEFFGLQREDALYCLEKAGLPVRYHGYYDEPRLWRVVEDGSVSFEGCELVSPILRYLRSSFMTTAKAVDTLRANGGRVDRTCGLHVHHNATTLEVPDVAECVALYSLFQPILNRLVSPSRWDSRYAAPMQSYADWHRRIMDQDSMRNLAEVAETWGRYYTVNVSALAAHGSLEFRQHQGTLNGEKITYWARLTKLFVTARERGLSAFRLVAEYGSADAVTAELGVVGMLQYLEASPEMIEFFRRREQVLNSGTGDFEDARTMVFEDDPYDENNEYDDEYDLSDEEGEWCDSCQGFHYDY